MVLHEFGGRWTEEKLVRLRKYLYAYMQIFEKNRWARRYTTYYVDAFAGTGSRIEQNEETTWSLFDSSDENDVENFYVGSARIALEISPPFDNYVFVDRNPEYAQQLVQLQSEFPSRSIQVHSGDANQFLQGWCNDMDWSASRAVVFLDPYGMAVDWVTIESIANTKAIDLWILLPIGQAINRMLTRQGPPQRAWGDKLTKFFGTESWEQAFYRQKQQPTLFEMEEKFEKVANFESIGRFFIERLESVFEKVSQNSLVLSGSNRPIVRD
ncbi:MAG: three-Cys-motif partner protein TcmP [Chloroflexota bacterium]